MDAKEIIKAIHDAPKKTPVKAYIKSKVPLSFPNAKVFNGLDQIVFGDYEDIKSVLHQHQDDIIDAEIEQRDRKSVV